MDNLHQNRFAVWTRRMAVAIGSMCLAIIPATTSADSIIDETLATVSSVQVVVVTEGMKYLPVPALDLRELESAVKSDLTNILEHHGLKTRDEAEALVELTFSKMSAPCCEDRYVVRVTMALREPAVLARHAKAGPTREEVVVTSWDSWRWASVTVKDARARLLSSACSLATELGERVASARFVSAGGGEK